MIAYTYIPEIRKNKHFPNIDLHIEFVGPNLLRYSRATSDLTKTPSLVLTPSGSL